MVIVWNKGNQNNEIISSCGTYKVCRIRRDKWVFFCAEKIKRSNVLRKAQAPTLKMKAEITSET